HVLRGGFLPPLGRNGEGLLFPQEEKRAAGHHRDEYDPDHGRERQQALSRGPRGTGRGWLRAALGRRGGPDRPSRYHDRAMTVVRLRRHAPRECARWLTPPRLSR